MVLWEDAPGVAIKSFGPAVLLRACVADQLGHGDRWSLRRHVESNALKGNSRVIQVAREDGADLRNGFAAVFAVLDLDEAQSLLARQLKRPIGTCKADLRDAFNEACGHAHVQLRMLDRNVETLVAKARHILGHVEPMHGKPGPVERDHVLNKLAAATPDTRIRLTSEVESFGRLVQRVAEALRGPEGP